MIYCCVPLIENESSPTCSPGGKAPPDRDLSMRLQSFLKAATCSALCALLSWPSAALTQAPGRQTPRPAAAEPEGETIKIATEMVQVAFAAVDGQNRLVKDLQASEIKVYDEGQLQKLEIFRLSNSVPMVLSILIDKSASQEAVLTHEKNAIDVFLDAHFRPGVDYCSLSTFQWKLALSTGLTNNPRQLKSALRGIDREQVFRDEEGGVPLLGTALYDALAAAVGENLTGRTARLITGEEGPAAVGGAEANTQRRAIRRAIILLSDGVDTASQASLEEAIALCQRHGIVVYALGIGDVSRQRQVNDKVLERLTSETGGIAFYPATELEIEGHFRKVVDALSSLYLVAFYPLGGESGKKFRRLDIKVPGRPGVKVIHRVGYAAEEKR